MGEGNAPHLLGQVSKCATWSAKLREAVCASAGDVSVDGGARTSSSCPSRVAASLKSAIGGRTEPEAANEKRLQKAKYSGSARMELGLLSWSCFIDASSCRRSEHRSPPWRHTT
jgi:hypothetical protein